MSADLLRRAAAKIRENAEVATPGPWESRRSQQADYIGFTDTAGFFAIARQSTWGTKGDVEHIASWHPDVALAAAKWLDMTADHMDPELTLDGGCSDCEVDGAMEFARAYLGAGA